MANPATERVWASLTPDEAAAFTKLADARGLRPSELARQALLAALGQPQQGGAAAVEVAPTLARLDALTEALGRHVAELGRLVPATDDALVERDEVRGALSDIAHAVGVMAGSLVSDDDDDGAEAAFGPDRN